MPNKVYLPVQNTNSVYIRLGTLIAILISSYPICLPQLTDK